MEGDDDTHPNENYSNKLDGILRSHQIHADAFDNIIPSVCDDGRNEFHDRRDVEQHRFDDGYQQVLSESIIEGHDGLYKRNDVDDDGNDVDHDLLES